ncbi:hypothetical protein BGX21_006083, partial [Mortierella sp. AD011]
MISKAGFLLNTKEFSPYRIIDSFAEAFDIKDVKEFIDVISTTLDELIGNDDDKQSEIFVRWKHVVETGTFYAPCARYFSKKAADEASALGTTLTVTFFVDISSTLPVARPEILNWIRQPVVRPGSEAWLGHRSRTDPT